MSNSNVSTQKLIVKGMISELNKEEHLEFSATYIQLETIYKENPNVFVLAATLFLLDIYDE